MGVLSTMLATWNSSPSGHQLSGEGRGGEGWGGEGSARKQEMLSREQAGARGTDLYEFKASLIYIETDSWGGLGWGQACEKAREEVEARAQAEGAVPPLPHHAL